MAYNTRSQALPTLVRMVTTVSQGVAFPSRTKTNSVPSQYLSVIAPLPDVPVLNPTKNVSGTIYQSGGVAVGVGVTVKLFRQADDRVMQLTTTNASGQYLFPRDANDTNTYYILAYTVGIPQTHGTSDRGVLPQ